MRPAAVVVLLAAAACRPATSQTPAAPPPPRSDPALLPMPAAAVPDAPPPGEARDLPEVLLLPSTTQDAWDLAEGPLRALQDYLDIANVVLGIPDHTNVPDVLPPDAIAAFLMLDSTQWTAVDPEILGSEARVVWPDAWGGGILAVDEALLRLEGRAVEDRLARWNEKASWPGFDLALTGLDGQPRPWPDGLLMVHHPLLPLSPEAAEALGGVPWVALGHAALDGPWPAVGPWIGWVDWESMTAALPPGADTLPLLLWLEEGEVVRWKGGLPPLEWLEPWT